MPAGIYRLFYKFFLLSFTIDRELFSTTIILLIQQNRPSGLPLRSVASKIQLSPRQVCLRAPTLFRCPFHSGASRCTCTFGNMQFPTGVPYGTPEPSISSGNLQALDFANMSSCNPRHFVELCTIDNIYDHRYFINPTSIRTSPYPLPKETPNTICT